MELTYASCIRAGQRAAAGGAARAEAGPVTHRVFDPASSRDPGRPGVPGIVHRRGRALDGVGR